MPRVVTYLRRVVNSKMLEPTPGRRSYSLVIRLLTVAAAAIGSCRLLPAASASPTNVASAGMADSLVAGAPNSSSFPRMFGIDGPAAGTDDGHTPADDVRQLMQTLLAYLSERMKLQQNSDALDLNDADDAMPRQNFLERPLAPSNTGETYYKRTIVKGHVAYVFITYCAQFCSLTSIFGRAVESEFNYIISFSFISFDD